MEQYKKKINRKLVPWQSFFEDAVVSLQEDAVLYVSVSSIRPGSFLDCFKPLNPHQADDEHIFLDTVMTRTTSCNDNRG